MTEFTVDFPAAIMLSAPPLGLAPLTPDFRPPHPLRWFPLRPQGRSLFWVPPLFFPLFPLLRSSLSFLLMLFVLVIQQVAQLQVVL